MTEYIETYGNADGVQIEIYFDFINCVYHADFYTPLGFYKRSITARNHNKLVTFLKKKGFICI